VRTMIHEWAAKAETSEVTASGGLEMVYTR
jgi:hypothetical protein